MKHYITLFLLIFSVFIAEAQSELTVSSAEVSFTFTYNKVKGTFAGFNSESVIDFDQIENSEFKGSVKTETISTGNGIRNWSLKRSKYFDSDNYPDIKFSSTSVREQNDIYIVDGQLTIKDVSEKVRFQFERNDKQLIGKAAIYSSDFGISIKDKRAENKVIIQIVLQLK